MNIKVKLKLYNILIQLTSENTSLKDKCTKTDKLLIENEINVLYNYNKIEKRTNSKNNTIIKTSRNTSTFINNTSR